MKRADLEHIIRACARIVGQDIVVIGSQAVLARHPQPPAPLAVSIEADVYPRAEPERAIEIDGAIGEGSRFHETFAFYAHGVGPETPRAPEGWESRLVPISNENTDGAVGWCMEIHDVVLSKCVAGRAKDWEYARAALAAGLVQEPILQRRAETLPLENARIREIVRTLKRLAGKHDQSNAVGPDRTPPHLATP